MRDFDRMMKEALTAKVQGVEPSENLLANIRKEAEERRKENGFMKMNMKKMMTAAAVICTLSVTCYAAGQFHSMVSSGEPNIETFAELEQVKQELNFDAKFVETFENGMTFQRGGTGETYWLDETGNETGKKYKKLSISYTNEDANETDKRNNEKSASYVNEEKKTVVLHIEEGSLLSDAGTETIEGYSCNTFLFLPDEDALTEEYQAMADAGEIFISYGTEEEEWKVMEHYSWEDDGVYYSLVASDGGFGEEAMAAMAAEIMAE